jgi:hypothetical protein
VIVAALTSCSSTADGSAWGEPRRADDPPSRAAGPTAAAGAPVATQTATQVPAAPDSDSATSVARPRLTRITQCLEGEARGRVSMTDVHISGDGKVIAFVADLKTGFFGLDRVERLVIYDVESGEPKSLKLEYGGGTLVPVRREFELSADGRLVGFLANEADWDQPAKTLMFVSEWRAGTVEPIDVHRYGVDSSAGPVDMEFSDDMSRVVVSLETNTGHAAGCLVIDRNRDEGHMLTPPAGGLPIEPSISGDGRFVAFENVLESNTPVAKPRGLWVHDLLSHTYELVPLERWADAQASEWLVQFHSPRISHSGRYIGLLGSHEWACGPLAGVLLVDRSAEMVSVISRDSTGKPTEAPCYHASVAEEGGCVLFVSSANLLGDDRNEHFDVFRYDLGTRRLLCVSTDGAGRTGNDYSFACDIAEDGQSIVFWSRASNLIPDDRNKVPDIFLWQR